MRNSKSNDKSYVMRNILKASVIFANVRLSVFKKFSTFHADTL